MITLNIQMPDNIHRFLEIHAAHSNATVQEFVMQAIRAQITSENIPNAETIKTFKESDKGVNLQSFASLNDLYKDLGIR